MSPKADSDDMSTVRCHYRLSILSFNMRCTDSMFVFPPGRAGIGPFIRFPSSHWLSSVATNRRLLFWSCALRYSHALEGDSRNFAAAARSVVPQPLSAQRSEREGRCGRSPAQRLECFRLTRERNRLRMRKVGIARFHTVWEIPPLTPLVAGVRG